MPESKDYSLDIFSLHKSSELIADRKKIDQLSTAEISFLSRALNLYYHYQEVANNQPIDPNIVDIETLLTSKNIVSLSDIASFLEKESNQTSQPEKVSKQRSESDQNNIPAELESMVALYKQHQADLLDSEREHTVSDTVKNIRKAWLEREKHRLVYENASKERQKQIDEEKEKFFRQSVDSKRTYQETTANIRQVAEGLLISQGINLSPSDKEEAIQRIVYAAQTRAITFDPKNTKNLYDISLLIKRDFLDLKTEIDKVDDVVQKQLTSIEIDNTETDNYKNDTELTYAEQDVNTQYSAKLAVFDREFKKYSSEHNIDGYLEDAKNDANRTITGLNKAIPNPRTLYNNPLDSIYKDQLEKAILLDTQELNRQRQQAGNLERIQLRPSTAGNEARVIGAISQTGGNVSSTIVDLYSRGITPQKLNEILSLSNSKTAKFLTKDLQQQVQFQLKKFHDSKLGEEFRKGYDKLKPLSDSYYRLSGTAQKILDPVGTTKDFLNKQIGQYAGKQIVKNTSNAAAQKFGKYLLENGLKEGAKKFADAAAKKLLIEGAKAVGVQGAKIAGMAAADGTIAAIAAGLGVPTGGLSLVIGAVLIVIQIGYEITIGLLKKGWQEIKDALGVTDEDDKESRKALLLGLAAIAASAIALKKSGKFFGTATKAALISAAGIIWLSLATIAIFLLLTFMVAPLLSTLVQFDSEEKVKYTPNIITSGECGWPIEPGFKVQSGPHGGTHSRSKLEAIDIFGDADINRKPIFSATDGIVVTDGDYSNYGHTIIIQTTNSAGPFKVIYGHVSSSNVNLGQTVTKGSKIGTVGSTDKFPKPHLHFEYDGITYNQCPAGGVEIPVTCVGFTDCGSVITGSGSTTKPKAK